MQDLRVTGTCILKELNVDGGVDATGSGHARLALLNTVMNFQLPQKARNVISRTYVSLELNGGCTSRAKKITMWGTCTFLAIFCWVVKSKSMRWAEQAAPMGQERHDYKLMKRRGH
jgi:hypothetical protein